MARRKDVDWNLPETNGGPVSWEAINAALLMDLRDELKLIRGLLGCYRIQRMFNTLERIDARLAKHAPLRKRKVKSP
jgi:hypothetical protein